MRARRSRAARSPLHPYVRRSGKTCTGHAISRKSGTAESSWNVASEQGYFCRGRKRTMLSRTRSPPPGTQSWSIRNRICGRGSALLRKPPTERAGSATASPGRSALPSESGAANSDIAEGRNAGLVWRRRAPLRGCARLLDRSRGRGGQPRAALTHGGGENLPRDAVASLVPVAAAQWDTVAAVQKHAVFLRVLRHRDCQGRDRYSRPLGDGADAEIRIEWVLDAEASQERAALLVIGQELGAVGERGDPKLRPMRTDFVVHP